jgi:hypothetical protein
MKQKELKQTAGRVYSQPGDAIQGEKVTAQARKIHKAVICTGTGSHQIHQTKLEGTVFCIIDRPLNYIRDLKPH